MNGTIYIVATPIGNLDDISIRAIKTIFSVDILLCEDTRRTGTLLSELKKRFPEYAVVSDHHPLLQSYYDEIEQKRLPEIIEAVSEGKNIALVSDNGTPTISDPGFRLVREARVRDIQVVSIPGASAVITALSVSGLPTNSFTFAGFLPEKQGARMQVLEKIKQSVHIFPATFIIYCAPHKLEQTLDDMQTVYGDIEIVIARELTKVHEEVKKLSISEWKPFLSSLKGECVLLFSLS